MKNNKLKIKIITPEKLYLLKEQVWNVCAQIYDMDEDAYYGRLSIFKDFALFYDGDKIVGFLSFFIDEPLINKKKICLFGVGHGTVLQAYRNSAWVQKAILKYYVQLLRKNPFRPVYIWGMTMTHLSFRMGMRYSKYRYPAPEIATPVFYEKILNYIGEKYYDDSYNAVTYTAAVKFSVKDQVAIPSEEELKDPIVADFVSLVPSSLLPDNRRGLIYVFPTLPNYWFWFRKLFFR